MCPVAQAQDDTTHSHLHRVQTYALEIGHELGLPDTELKALRAAAILHDVGKLAVPEHIISKPGKLSPEEFEKMKTHTVVGGEIVEQLNFPFAVAPMVRGHHEKWDGSGYPDGLAGEDIPIGARILSAVDCFDALVTDRQYRRALTLPEAIEIVRRESGKAFDPRIVALLDQRHEQLERLARSSFPTTCQPMSALKVMRGNAPDAGLEVSQPGAGAGDGAKDSVERLRRLVKVRSAVNSVAEALQSIPQVSRLVVAAGALSALLREMVTHDALVLFERVENRLLVQGAAGVDQEFLSRLEVPEGRGVAGWVALNRKPILNADPKVEPGMAPDTELRAVLGVPLLCQESLRGVICLYRRQKDSFTRADLQVIEYLAHRIAEIALEAKAPVVDEGRPEPSTDEPMQVITVALQGVPSAEAGGPAAERLVQRCLDIARESLTSGACERIGRNELAVWIRDVPTESIGLQLGALQTKLGELSQQGLGPVNPAIEAITINPDSTLNTTSFGASRSEQKPGASRPAYEPLTDTNR